MSLHFLESAARMQIQPPSKKLVLMCLADSAGNDTGIALPGREALMEWAQIGPSTLKKYLSELEADGWIQRTSVGRKGRRSEYAVFAQRPCCDLHAPQQQPFMPPANNVAEHPTSRPHGPAQSAHGPVDNYPNKGADTAAPNDERGRPWGGPYSPKGADIGADKGADPGAAPSVSPDLSIKGGESKSPERAAEFPQPPAVEAWDDSRCQAHQSVPLPPPCRACAAARERHEKLEAAQRRQAGAAERERRLAARAEAERRIAECQMCDDRGRRRARVCSHVPEREAYHDEQKARQAEVNRAGIEMLRRTLNRKHSTGDNE